jgi:ubiquinone/menaquinone biosynthesis C-methylase UbiE
MNYWNTHGDKQVSLDEATRRKIQEKIKDKDKVLDLGSAKCIFTRANYIVDILDYEDRSTNKSWGPKKECFTKDTWIKADIHDKLQFEDNYFDFSICTHTLEDIKDPISVCEELIRVSKAGYIECPSREVESIAHLKTEGLIGYGNHRWFVDIEKNNVTFTHKTPYIYCSITMALAPWYEPQSTYIGLFWENSFEVGEKIIVDTSETIKDQEDFIRRINDKTYEYQCYNGYYKL